jgi:hypothetical protein
VPGELISPTRTVDLMSGKSIKLHPETCEYWHTKEQVAEILNVSVTTIYAYIRNGLRVGRHGTIYCPWIRDYYEGEDKQVAS